MLTSGGRISLKEFFNSFVVQNRAYVFGFRGRVECRAGALPVP